MNRNFFHHNVLYVLLIAAVSMVPSCDEEFPPYRTPANVLDPRLTLTAPDTIDVYRDGLTGEYFFNTPMVLRITVVNIHDDLLEGEARVGGKIVAQSFAEIPRTAVVQLTTGNLLRPPVFQGKIAIPPGNSADFSILWVPYATDGKIIFEDLPFTQVGNARIYGPIDFIATAEVQIFERVQAIQSRELRFSQSFRLVTQ